MMKTINRYKRIIALMLAFVMIVQSSVSSVSANTISTEATKNTAAVSTVEDTNGTETTTGTKSTDATSATTAQTNSNIEFNSKITQSIYKKDGKNFVKYTVLMRNLNTAAAGTTNVKVLLPETMSYVDDKLNTTPGLKVFKNQTVLEEGYNLNEFDRITLAKYKNAQVMIWKDLQFKAGQERELTVIAEVTSPVQNVYQLDSVWSINGQTVKGVWENVQDLILAPATTAANKTTETQTAATTEAEEEEKKEEQKNPVVRFFSGLARSVANVLNVEVSANTSTKFSDYITGVEMKSSTGDNTYNAVNPAENNGYFLLNLKFAENANYQLPVYDESNAAETTVAYTIPAGIKGIDPITDAVLYDENNRAISWGTYDVVIVRNPETDEEEYVIKFYFNEKVLTSQGSAGKLTLSAQFDREKVTTGDPGYDFDFEGLENVVVKFIDGENIATQKKASDYDASTDTFTFDISITADTELENVVLTDTMDAGLIFKDETDSLTNDKNGTTVEYELTKKSDTEFVVKIDTLPKGDYTFSYKVSLDRERLLEDPSKVLKFNNSVVIDADGINNPVGGSDEAEYDNTWLKKEGDLLDSGKIKWTLTVNPDGKQDVSKLKITDVLDAGLNFDQSIPINVTPALNGSNEISWDKVNLTADGRKWTYTMPDNAGSIEYVFTYYTTVENGISGTKENTAKLGAHEATDGVDVSTNPGVGRGTIGKTSGDIQNVNGVRYVPWTATINLKAGEHTNVVYRDQLAGAHEFSESMGLRANDYDEVRVTLGSGITLAEGKPEFHLTADNMSFTIAFGNLNLAADSTITIQYYTIADTGKISNVGDLDSTGLTTSDSSEKTVIDSDYSKSGVFDEEKGEITWKIVLNEKDHSFPGGSFIITDMLPTDLKIKGKINEMATIYVGGEALESKAFGVVDEDTNTVTMYLPRIEATTEEVYIKFVTTIPEGLDRSKLKIYTNNASIKYEDEEPKSVQGQVELPSNSFDKTLLDPKPDASNNYRAHFEIIVNETGIGFGAGENGSTDYIITDKLSSNMSLHTNSLKVYKKNGDGWDQLGTEVLEKGTYFAVVRSGNDITINIKNPEITTIKTYKIEYEATINVGGSDGNVIKGVKWDNKATFKAGDSEPITDKEEGIVKTQGSDATVGGDLGYITVFKYDAENLKGLPNAQFAIYEINVVDGEEVESSEPYITGVTDANGMAHLGEDLNGGVSIGNRLQKGQRYVLKETTAPQGYKVAHAPYYFQIGNEIKDTKYESIIYGFQVEVANVQETSIKVVKSWDDNNNQDNLRPDNVQVQLYKDGTAEGAIQTLNADNNWTYTWSGLAKGSYVNNTFTAYNYTVKEITEVEGYEPEPDTSSEDLVEGNKVIGKEITITNTHTPEKVSQSVQKVWDDANNQDGIRPESITVQLKANNVSIEEATLNPENGWSKTWDNLDKYENGEEIIYTIVESNVPEGYTLSDSEVEEIKNNDNEVIGHMTTLTNTHNVEKTKVKVVKVWNDNDNASKNRPTAIKVQLKANGVAVKREELNANNNWTYTWDDLDKNSSGSAIVYTVEEKEVPAAYTKSTEKTTEGTDTTVFTITNTLDTQPTSYSVVKVWDDEDNQDGKRPPEIKVKLLADDVASGKEVILNEENGWKYTWENLTKYKNGELIEYTAKEVGIPAGYEVTYEVNADKTETIITNSIEVEKTEHAVKKVWDDANNQDGKRPKSITVQLYADGKAVTGKKLALHDGNNWIGKWSDLAKYENGELITYTADEVSYENSKNETIVGVPADYVKEDPVTKNGMTTITNKHAVEKTEISVKKVWDDANNQDRKRPENVTVRLYANKEDTGKTLTLDKDNKWAGSWAGLDVYARGNKIKYTIEEVPVDGYTPDIQQDDQNEYFYTVTNSYSTEKTSLSVKKVWDDANNQDGKRPPAITVQLYADDKAVDGGAVELNKANKWTYTWSNLEKYKDGVEINYSVDEISDLGVYTKSGIETVDNVEVITNSYTPETTKVSAQKVWDDNDDQDGIRPDSVDVELKATIGEDEEVKNFAGKYKVTVEKTLSADNNWKTLWTNLPVYDDGKIITYSVVEKVVPDKYDCKVASPTFNEKTKTHEFTLTNSYETEETQVSVKKEWNDDNNRDGIRPTNITVQLYADGEAYGDPVKLNEGNNWSTTWAKLDLMSKGKKITYTVDEMFADKDGNLISGQPEGYAKVIEGENNVFTITNTHGVAKTSRTVKKVWDDANNQDGVRPLLVYVTLLADGDVVDIEGVQARVELNESNDWKYTWTNLPVYTADGTDKDTEIQYTIREDSVSGYNVNENEPTISFNKNAKENDPANTFTLTNKRTPDVTSKSVVKVWDDDSNRDGIRPTSIDIELSGSTTAGTVNLEDYGVDTDVTLNVTNNTDGNANTWEYEWTELPVKHNGEVITYSVKEVEVPTGYEESYSTVDGNEDGVVDGFIITNKHTTDVLQRTLVKYWKDNNDMTNRPDKVTFQLMKSEYDGSGEVTDDANWTAKEKVGKPVEFEGSISTWTYTWINLTKKANGQDIRYSVEELNIPAGYEVLYDGDDFIFTATNVKTNIEISKTSLTDGALIAGATLEIRDKDNKVVVGPWTSETTAELVSGILKVGETYKLVETKAPAGHTIAEPVEFTVNNDGKIQKVTMVDEPTVVKIKKTDLTGEKEIAGATLQIVDSKGEVVEEWTSALEAHIITAKLNIGETYTLKETAAPLGYAYTTDIKFMLNNKGKVEKVDGETADVPMAEDGTILVKDTPLELRVNKVELTSEKEIAGAVLELYAADDVNEDGTIKEGAKSIGQWMSEVGTTHDFGSVIQAGKSYVLVETVPADGYGYASNIHFEVKDDGKIVTTAKQTKDKDDNVVYLMEDDFTRVSITKTDITGEKILEGAVLQIFDKEGNAVTESWTSEEKATLIEGTLKAGHEYILRELKAPAGYALANDVTFKVNNDGTPKKVSMKDSMTKVEITKKDITTGEELPGATLQVIDSEGDVIDEWISTEEAHVIEGVLVAGAAYTLREVLSPDGYAVAKDVEFVVTDKVDKDGNVVVDSVVMEDSFTEVSIKKTDITGKNELVGAELQLVDKDGNEIDKWTSEETAHVITGKLIVGETYTLKELTPPEGYAFAADVTFEIGADGKAIVAEESKAADGTILMKDTKTEVAVTKVDEENKPLVGAILAIKDMETGKIIEQWTTTEEPYKVSGKVVVGKEYYLTELMVPEGYQFAGDITFKVPEDGIVELSMVDTKLESNKGTIKVVKKLAALDGLDFVDLITEEGVFYVGLFTDEAGKHPFGTDNVKEIKITKDSVSEPVVYENLPAGTYYVIETDKDGNPLKLDEQHKDAAGNTFVCIVDVGATNKVEIDLDTAKTAGTVELTNVFYDLPDGFSYSASIDITKEVLKDEKPVNVDDTFYAGIFTKEADGTYKLYQEVTLKQNDKVTVKVPLGGENGDQPITYYVFETDGKGAMVDKTAFVYDVSGEGEVSVSKTALTGAITITNIVPDDVFELEILKVNEEDETLKGATFVLETQDGTEVATWKSGKFARVLNLTAGTYILTETKAPKGYVIGEDIKIVIDKDGTITVEGENATLEDNVVSYINEAEEVEEDEEDDEDGGSKKSTSTKTGDRTNMEIYMLLMAAAVITALAVARRKREEDL